MKPGISTLDTRGTSTHDAARHDGKRLFIDGSVLLACVVLVGVALASLMVTASPAGASTGSTGILTGNVIVKGAPAGFFGEVGVAVCPSGTAAAASVGLCSSPQFAVSGSGGSYTLSLAVGTWQVREFYSLGYGGGAFIGRPRIVTIGAGQTVRQNIAIAYQEPSAVSGTVAVGGVPLGVTIEQQSVIACPSSSPIVGNNLSPLCATDFLNLGTSRYSIPTLSKGTWLLYVGYYTEFGLTTVQAPGMVKLVKGESLTDNLSVTYQAPPNGLVEGTVTITGAPAGFSPLFGVGGCPTSGGSTTGSSPCPSPEYAFAGPGGAYALLLPEGSWGLAGFYELAPFGGQFLSAIQSATVNGGAILHLNFTVPYVAPATITSTITVTNVPAGTTIEATVLLACPTIAPYTGGVVPIECVEGFAAPGPGASINTLPPGKWLLYPGYETSVTGTIGTTPTSVRLKSGQSKNKNLVISYSA